MGTQTRRRKRPHNSHQFVFCNQKRRRRHMTPIARRTTRPPRSRSRNPHRQPLVLILHKALLSKCLLRHNPQLVGCVSSQTSIGTWEHTRGASQPNFFRWFSWFAAKFGAYICTHCANTIPTLVLKPSDYLGNALKCLLFVPLLDRTWLYQRYSIAIWGINFYLQKYMKNITEDVILWFCDFHLLS